MYPRDRFLPHSQPSSSGLFRLKGIFIPKITWTLIHLVHGYFTVTAGIRGGSHPFLGSREVWRGLCTLGSIVHSVPLALGHGDLGDIK